MSQLWPVDEALLARLPARDAAANKKPGNSTVTFAAEGYVPQLLERCAELHQKDKTAEKLKVLGWTGAIVGGLGAVIVAFTAASMVAAAILAIVAIACGIMAVVVSAQDIEDRQLEVISGVLTTFAPELRANRPVSVQADFTSLHKTTPRSSEKLAGGLFVMNVHAYEWRHPWLRLALPLADGSTARLELSTQLKRKTKQKRKYTKITDKLVDQLTVQLLPPKGKSFATGRKTHRPNIPGLTMTRAVAKPNAAAFTFRSPTAQRYRTRAGWSSAGTELLFGSAQVVSALIHTYQAVASAQRVTGES
jgi:hypothetical protein